MSEQVEQLTAVPMGKELLSSVSSVITEFGGEGPVSSTDPGSSSSLDLAGQLYSSLSYLFTTMDVNTSCLGNCSGRGECQEGVCLCQVQYHGDSCTDPNMAYFICFATIFYLIALISLTQLMVCIRSEYRRMKTPSLRSACVITTQKLLYIITFIAATLRGAYFSSPANADLPLSSSFMSAFYPIILTAGSLIVCFWAEAFHLRDIRCERPRFLSKSFCGFLAFNFITYSLFLTDIILTKETDSEERRSFLNHVFNGCYAVLLFIVVVFFLIYGVEVYFKVRGGFVNDSIIVSNVRSRAPPTRQTQPTIERPLLEEEASQESLQDESKDPLTPSPDSSLEDSATISGIPQVTPDECPAQEPGQHVTIEDDQVHIFTGFIPKQRIDQSQLHQSRFGLVFQAFMLMITVCFLWSDVLGELWKNKVQLVSRNAYDVLFRVVEIAVALWFPCVLWNCIYPEQLWILNPKKILKKLDLERTLELGQSQTCQASCTDDKNDLIGECWICYDSETTEFGPLIYPCDCKGDVGAVHHNCLRKWLMECTSNSPEELSCKVCGAAYQLEQENVWWIGKGFTARQWLQTASLITVMCGTIAGLWAAMQLTQDTMIRALAAGGTLIIFNICLRLLGFNIFTAYERAKISAVKILGSRFSSSSSSATTASTSAAETASKPLSTPLTQATDSFVVSSLYNEASVISGDAPLIPEGTPHVEIHSISS